MRLGLVGRKIGMTRVFADDGSAIPVTVLDVANNRVTQIKTPDTDGYAAVQVAFGKRRAIARRQAAGRPPREGRRRSRHVLREFPVAADALASLKAGDVVGADTFAVGQLVDVTGTTKGRGFSGVIRRHHFSSNRASHGNSVSHNKPGSIGMAQDPGRVFPGKRLPGHYGNVTRTVQTLTVVRVDKERGLLLVKGSVPGADGSARHRARRREDAGEEGGLTMDLKLINDNGEPATTAHASDALFGRDYNEALIHQVVTAYQANGRQGTRAQKARGDMNKSHKKPWRQKGTGRARAGQANSPLWRGGGKIFPSSPDENFSHKVNRKMYRAGIASILSQLVREDRLAVIEASRWTRRRPSSSRRSSRRSACRARVLIVTDKLDENLYLASRNLPNVLVLETRHVDPVSLVRFEHVLLTKAAVAQFEESSDERQRRSAPSRTPSATERLMTRAARAGDLGEGHAHRRQARAGGVPRRCRTRPSPRSRPRSS